MLNLMMNKDKLMFFYLMIISNLMILLSNYWMNMWIWLEMNLISFIFLMMNHKNFITLEASMIYFLIQTIASIILIYSIIFFFLNKNLIYFFFISMMMKLSMAPLHFWMPMMIESINWFMIYLLLTWQKIGPLILLNLINILNNKLMMYIMFSFISGSIIGLNYSSLKKIMAYSSINQMSWIMISLMLMNKMFKMYFMMYLYLMLMVLNSFNLLNLKFLFQMFMIKINKYKNMFMFTNLMSLGGLPPFLGFFPKMLIMNKLNNSMLMMMMIIFTLITLFFYIRIMLSSMMLNSLKMNIIKLLNFKNKIKFMLWMSLLNNLMLLIIMIFY